MPGFFYARKRGPSIGHAGKSVMCIAGSTGVSGWPMRMIVAGAGASSGRHRRWQQVTIDTRKFYKSRAWRRKRRDILKRDKECLKCKDSGRYSPPTCVHHIQHLSARPDLALVDSNLISLCDSCHNKEHPEKFQSEKAKQKEYITPERW